MNNKIIGKAGETLAEALLESKSYQIITRNYSCRFGEVDIIARKGGRLCFVEVKTRLNDNYGTGVESVDMNKQRHIRNVAGFFIASTNIYYDSVEFQVIEIGARHIEELDF